ncbi:MAG: class I SAM-dependent methyltransferase [Anaerolineales bacterium]|nr:class I SAM-dependent methyltransferase [Anaerolineales bacterium]
MKRFFFNIMYFGRAPWDSGISPPELLDFIENHPAGRAIDLGCGTGTNVVTLAQNGWQVSGVDFVPRAIKIARRKVRQAHLQADMRVGDVTQLKGISGPYDLALDMGCFHNLGDKKADYLNRLDEILAPGGFWLLYAHLLSPREPNASHGLAPVDMEAAATRFDLISRMDSLDKIGRDSVWALFQKPTM